MACCDQNGLPKLIEWMAQMLKDLPAWADHAGVTQPTAFSFTQVTGAPPPTSTRSSSSSVSPSSETEGADYARIFSHGTSALLLFVHL
jgi:hypothetical protein